MIQGLVPSILLVLFVSIGIHAQVRQGRDSSVQERAQKLEPFIVDSAQRYGIDPRILRVLCYLESRYRLEAVSPKGARGPMQFMPETASRYALQNPHDPKTAIDAGARYFRDLLRRYDGKIPLALAAYNAGEGTVDAFLTGHSLRLANGRVINPAKTITGGIPPYRETQEYVRSAIGFLANRATTPTNFSNVSLRNRSIDSANPSRDFTIDVIAIENFSPLHSTEKAKSVFIVIQ
ncbi:MAG: lytic transglycosylase domain-containing protein [bacterium]